MSGTDKNNKKEDQSVTETQSTEEEARRTALRKAYTAATKRLREANQTQFNQLYSEEAKKNGVEWNPRPTTEEKAKQDLVVLLTEHPHLVEIVEEIARQGGEVPPGIVPSRGGPAE